MSRPHDIGGTRGLGPVPIERDEPVFHERWHGRALGISLSTAIRQLFPIDEHRAALGAAHPTAYRAMSYWETWIVGFERVLLRHGVLDETEIEDRLRALEADPDLPLPERRDEEARRAIRGLIDHGAPFVRERDEPPRYRHGDAVRPIRIPAGSAAGVRLPAYAQGKPGVVDRVHPALTFADTAVAGEGDHPDYVYTVRFRARDLWPDAGGRDTVCVDLFERYLTPASAPTVLPSGSDGPTTQDSTGTGMSDNSA